jgi:phosphotransferase system enzyme I (PtsI)
MDTSASNPASAPNPRRILRGVPVSPGIAIGPAYLLHPRKREVSRKSIAPEHAERELLRLRRALDVAAKEIRAIRDRIGGGVGEYEARIFDSHALILRDEEILAAVARDIRENLNNAEHAFYRQMNLLAERFDAAKGGFLKEHLVDLRDVAARVIDILTLAGGEETPELRDPVVLLARALTPSGLSQFAPGKLLGLCLETGGKASHTAILARSMEIPAVSGIPWSELGTDAGRMVIVDGDEGHVILNPSLRDIKEHEIRRSARHARETELQGLRDLEPVTRDGKYVSLAANVELPGESESVKRHGATGVGLYRSEFLFLGRDDMPTEEEQYQAYRTLAEALAPQHVTIRTLDAGGDKQVAGMEDGDERNPHMGWRSIRVSLRNPGPFKTQLRAILRAGATANVRLLFPMISNLQEFRAARKLAEEASAELKAEGIPHDADMETGCMIEVPSAALMAADLAREADFFSIGTNDLAQFTLAVDRSNERVSDLLEPHSPAVLREIHGVVEAARTQGIPVTICGEMAADPHLALMFVGMGVDELSMSPVSIPELKRLIRAVGYEAARQCAREALRRGTAEEVHAYVEECFAEVYGRTKKVK